MKVANVEYLEIALTKAEAESLKSILAEVSRDEDGNAEEKLAEGLFNALDEEE